jgi:hypothetical protein
MTACFYGPPTICSTILTVFPKEGFALLGSGTPGDVVGLVVSTGTAAPCQFASAQGYATVDFQGSFGFSTVLPYSGSFVFYQAADAAGYCSNTVMVFAE